MVYVLFINFPSKVHHVIPIVYELEHFIVMVISHYHMIIVFGSHNRLSHAVVPYSSNPPCWIGVITEEVVRSDMCHTIHARTHLHVCAMEFFGCPS